MELNENVTVRFLIRSEAVVTTSDLIDEQDAEYQFFEEVWSGWEGYRSDLQIEKLRITSVVELPDDPDEYVALRAVQAETEVVSTLGQTQNVKFDDSSSSTAD